MTTSDREKCLRCKGWGYAVVVVGTSCFGPIRRTIRCPHCQGRKLEPVHR